MLYVIVASIVLVILGDGLKKLFNVKNDTFFPFAIHALAIIIIILFLFLGISSQKNEAELNYIWYLEAGGLIILFIYLASFLILIQKPGYKEKLFRRSKK
jgi:hypothetical protein